MMNSKINELERQLFHIPHDYGVLPKTSKNKSLLKVRFSPECKNDY